MNLKEALEEAQYCDNLPIARRCSECENWLDDKTKIIVSARPAIEYVISHGLCEDCEILLYGKD